MLGPKDSLARDALGDRGKDRRRPRPLIGSKLAGNHDQRCRKQQPKSRLRHAGCPIAADDDSRQGADQKHAHKLPVYRTHRPMPDPGNQGQRYRVRDVGADDTRHRQLRIKQQERRDADRASPDR